MNKCKHFDPELNICQLHSDWSSPMPVLTPCIESPCEDYSPPKEWSREAVENEFINRKDLINNLNRFAPEHYSSLVNSLIMKQPAADVAEVVRCKDCKYSVKYTCKNDACYNFTICRRRDSYSEGVEEDDFCSYGERKDTENG